MGRFASEDNSQDATIGDDGIQAPPSGGLAAFVDRFSNLSESFWFYDHTIEIRFDPVEHQYFLVDPELGNLELLYNASTVSHIVDRSEALVPWSAKVAIEKLLRNIPTVEEGDVFGQLYIPTLYVPKMSLADFTKIALDAKSAHKDKLEDAGEVGKMAHAWIEDYIKAVLAGNEAAALLLSVPKCADERANNCVNAAFDWMRKHNVRWKETERKVYSKKHKCSGTLDGLCLVDSCDDPLCCETPFKDRLTVADWKTSNYLYLEYLFQTAYYEGAYEEEFGVDVQDRWVLRLGKDDGEFEPWHLTADDFEDDWNGFLACLHLRRLVDKIDARIKSRKNYVRAKRKEQKAAEREIKIAKERAEKAAAKAEKKLLKQKEKEEAKKKAKEERERLRAELKAEKLKQKAGNVAEPSVANNVVEAGTSAQTQTTDIVSPEAEREQRPVEQPIAETPKPTENKPAYNGIVYDDEPAPKTFVIPTE